MARYASYPLPIPQTRLLASMESIKQDLLCVREYCDKLDLQSVDRPDHVLWQALWEATVVRYARCFSPGARDHLRHDLLDSASKEHRALHDYLMAVRNKHVAHSVNWFEETEVTVTLNETDGTVTSINAGHGRMLGLAFDLPARIRELAQWLLDHISVVASTEREKLLSLARALGAEKIREFGPSTLGSNSMDDDPWRGRNRP